MSAVEVGSLPEGQQEALEALHSIARASEGALTVDLDYTKLDSYLVVRVYLASASLRTAIQGIKLEGREPIDILIPQDFPYRPPIAWSGRADFPELPHQAKGSGFCVRVEDNNWDYAAGMPGFLRSVIDTYQHIALGTLQGHLQPWRPTGHTVSYYGAGCAVIKADLPHAGRIEQENGLWWAVGVQVSDNRIDIVEWLEGIPEVAPNAQLTKTLAGKLARIQVEHPDALLVPAVNLAKPVALEYALLWKQLRAQLAAANISWTSLVDRLTLAVAVNQAASGGEDRAALLFRVAPDTESTAARQDARFALARLTQGHVEYLAGTQPGQVGDASLASLRRAIVPWVQVYDGRPGSTLRRAAGRPTERLAKARILLLGCGGLGAPIAEHCVRSGAARVHIVDSGTVSPGVLSRQPYEDADIGQPKAEALAARLGRVRPESEITASVADLVSTDFFRNLDLSQYDLVIDATANRSVAAKIERDQRDHHSQWPTLITVAISQQATHGVAGVTPQGAVGAGVDLLRRLGLKSCPSTALGDVYTAFFPSEASRLNFRPDATCSDTTFIGSSTDISALAAQLLHGALARSDPDSGRRSLIIVRIGLADHPKAGLVTLDLAADRVLTAHGQPYEVRVEAAALQTIREYARASANGRKSGGGLTGGLLLGQFERMCQVAWVSQATGLPPGSTVDRLDIDWNGNEVQKFIEERSGRSGGMLTLIGFWRVNRGDSTTLSETDRVFLRKVAASPAWRSASALILAALDSGSCHVDEWPSRVHAEVFGAVGVGE